MTAGDLKTSRLAPVSIGRGIGGVEGSEEQARRRQNRKGGYNACPSAYAGGETGRGRNTAEKYFVATVSGAIGGDGYVSVAMKRVELASGERAVILLWAVALAAHGIEAEVRRTRGVPSHCVRR